MAVRTCARRWVLASVLVGGVSHAALVAAGIADAALPQFADGKAAVLVMAIPGVVHRDRLQTEFLCSSVDSVPVNIGVEIFGTDGARLNDIAAGTGAVLGVTPGQTVTIATGLTVSFVESVTIPLGAARIQGSARVVGSSDRVRCNVMVVDDLVAPPVALATLGSGIRPVRLPAVDPPLPRFADGTPATTAAVFPGIIKRGPMQSSFLCTSLTAAPIHLGVEIVSPAGKILNDIASGNGAVLNVPPGSTVTLSTTGTAGLLESGVISSVGVAQGSARVVSTSEQVACIALALDATTSPPAAMTGLAGTNALGH